MTGRQAERKRAGPGRPDLPVSLSPAACRARPSAIATKNACFASTAIFGYKRLGEAQEEKKRAPGHTHTHTQTHTEPYAHTHLGTICTRACFFPKHLALHARQHMPAYVDTPEASAASPRSEPRAFYLRDEHHIVQQ